MVISALGIDKTLKCIVQGITQYGVHNLLARVGTCISRQNESWFKNNVPNLEGQFVGGGRLEIRC